MPRGWAPTPSEWLSQGTQQCALACSPETTPHPASHPPGTPPGCLAPGPSRDPLTWPRAGRAAPWSVPSATSPHLPILGPVRPSSRPALPLGPSPRSPLPSDYSSQTTVGKPVSLSLLGWGPRASTTLLQDSGSPCRLTTCPFPPHICPSAASVRFARLLWSPSPSHPPSLPPLGGQTDLCRCECPHALPCAERLLGPPFFPWAVYKDSPYLGLGAQWPACLFPRAAHANPSPICSRKHHALISHRAFACVTPLPGSILLERCSLGKPSPATPSGHVPLVLLHCSAPVPVTHIPGSAPGPGGRQRTKLIQSWQRWGLHPGKEKAGTRRVSNYGACSRTCTPWERGESRETGCPRLGWAWVQEPSRLRPAGPFRPERWVLRSMSLLFQAAFPKPTSPRDHKLWSPIYRCMRCGQQVPRKCQLTS